MKQIVLLIFIAFFTCGRAMNSVKTEVLLYSDTTKTTILKTSTETMPQPQTFPKTADRRINHSQWTALLQEYVSSKGNVNYKEFDRDKLSVYITFLSQNTPNNSWSRNETLAYWINAYNALTVDLILRHYPIKSIKDIDKPWKQKLWTLGDQNYSLDQIEHEIIRKMGEPRIHFALVCAAESCPKLYNRAFEASNLEIDLYKLTVDFLNDTSKNNIAEKKLQLSKIFQWFTTDFKQNGSLIDFLNQYTEVEISKKAKISYKEYNWSLNE